LLFTVSLTLATHLAPYRSVHHLDTLFVMKEEGLMLKIKVPFEEMCSFMNTLTKLVISSISTEVINLSNS
jgi:hypothetical protein